MYYLQTLGHLSIHPESPDRPPLLSDSKSLAVLAYLCVDPGSSAGRDRIASLFWPDADRSHARQSLRQALHYLSRKVGEQLVEASQRELAVRSDLLDVDVWALDRALAEGNDERVLELHGGPFLSGVAEKLGRELETWVEAQNERVWTGLHAAHHRLVLESLEEGDAERALSFARSYVELNPFREDAQLALVRALDAAERPVAAIQAYESYRSLLRDELDDEPGTQIRRHVDRLRERVFRSPRIAEPGPAGGDARAGPGDPGPPEATTPETDRDVGRRQPAAPRASETGASGPPDASHRTNTGASDPPAAGHPAPAEDAWRPLVSAVAVVGLLVLLVRPGIDPGSMGERALPAGPWALAVVSGSGGTFSLVPDGDSVRLESRARSWRHLPRPGADVAAGQVRTPRGWDLALVDGEGRPTEVLVSRPDDEIPLTWSPDGSSLVFQAGFMAPDGVHYRRRLGVLDVESGMLHRLPRLQTRVAVRADWAPSGAWIVFGAEDESGDHEVYRALPDGTGVTNLSRSPGFDGEPAWSPDGRWIAFVSERTGSRSIHLLAPDGERVVALVDSGFDDHHPVWLGPDRLLYLSTRRDETDVWMYDLDTGDRQRLTHRGDFRRLRAAPAPSRRWIEQLRIRPRPERVAPGQWLRLVVDGIGPGGDPVPVPEGVVTWSTEDGPAIRSDGEGLFRIGGSGRSRIIATLPGWRADTLVSVARAPVRRDPPLLFHETWTDGIRPTRWNLYGRPAPTVVERDGRFRRAFRSNGDAHFDSGVVSRARFAVEKGATLEVWARLPLHDRHYQGLQIALVAEPAPAGTVAWSAPGRSRLRVGLRGHPEGPRIHLFDSGSPVPPPDSLGRWHRYALQIDQRRVPSLVVDGRVHWRGEPLPEGALADSVHVVLAGRTVDTDVLTGPVTLFRGPRYTIPEAPGLTRSGPGTRDRADAPASGG